MFSSSQRLYALYPYSICSGSFYLGSHLVEKVCQIHDFRLFRSIFYIGSPFRKDSRHHYVLCRPHAWKVQIYGLAHEALSSGHRFYIIVAYSKDSAQRFKSFEMKINRPGAYGASSRKRHSGPSLPGKERPHHQYGCSHLIYQFKICFRSQNIFCVYGQHIFSRLLYFRTERRQKFFHQAYIPELRNVSYHTFLFGKERSCHKRQDGVFRPAYLHLSSKGSALLYNVLCQFYPPDDL